MGIFGGKVQDRMLTWDYRDCILEFKGEGCYIASFWFCGDEGDVATGVLGDFTEFDEFAG